MNENKNILLDLDGTSLARIAGGTSGNIFPQCYFAGADNEHGLSVEPGTVRLGSDGTRGYCILETPFTFGDDPSFSLTLQMKVESLMTPYDWPSWRGLTMEIHIPGNRLLAFALHSMTEADADGRNATAMLRKENMSGDDAFSQRITIPTDDAFHLWDIQFDGNENVRLYIDGKLQAIFSGVKLDTPAEETNGLFKMGNVMVDVQNGKNALSIAQIRLTAGAELDNTTILDASLLPGFSAKKMTVRTEINSLSANAEIEVSVCPKDDPANTFAKSYKPAALISDVTVENLPFSGPCLITVRLTNALPRTFERYLYTDLADAAAGASVTDAQPGAAYIYSDMASLASDGWKSEAFARSDGKNGTAIVISAEEAPTAVTVPVKLNGKFAVYIGYLPGTKNLSVNGKNVFITYKVMEENVLNERFALACDFAGEEITIENNEGSEARIAYVKFVALSEEKYAKYTAEDDSHNLFTDNDGFSMLCGSSKYENPDTVNHDVITRYVETIDQRKFNWATFSTSILNYNSPVWWKYVTKRLEELGIPKENYPKDFLDHVDVNGNHMDFDDKMRDLDKTAYNNMRALNKYGFPHEMLGKFAADNNYGEVFASLRMSHFNAGAYGFQCGSMYYLHPEWIRKGGPQFSYAHEEYRNYIHDILIEMASAEHVTGITMDFGRYYYIFGEELTDVKERTRIMNDFVRSVRRDLPKGKILNARVLNPTAQKAEIWGLDYKTWVKEGLIDRLLLSDQGHESFFDLKPYMDFMKDTENVEVYIGINATLTGHDLTKAEENMLKKGLKIKHGTGVSYLQFMLRAYEAYMAGADGIFIFNGFSHREVGGLHPGYANMNNKTKMVKWYEFEYPAYLFSEEISPCAE